MAGIKDGVHASSRHGVLRHLVYLSSLVLGIGGPAIGFDGDKAFGSITIIPGEYYCNGPLVKVRGSLKNMAV